MIRTFLFTLIIWSFAMNAAATPETLQGALQEKIAASASQIPAEAQKVMQQGISELRNSDIKEKAIASGAKLPEHVLVNSRGKDVSLRAVLGDRPAVVTFYRGGWCPYCNLQLHYYQKALPQIQKHGAQLIAISPETPDNSLSTSDKNNLSFTVLSDHNNEFARKLGLVFTLSPELQQLYAKFGIDLKASQGTESGELPLAATLVVDKGGVVRYRFIDEDYKKRAAVEDVLNALKTLE